MLVPRDFVLTQAALGEDLKSADGRSVIKVTHQPIPPHWFDSDDEDSDEELDSELEEELEDEFELSEEDAEEDEEKPKAKVNGKKADEAAEEDEEEDEDEDDEDEDSDFSDDDELAETNVICSLLAGRVSSLSSSDEHSLTRTGRASLGQSHLYRGRGRHVRGDRREVRSPTTHSAAY